MNGAMQSMTSSTQAARPKMLDALLEGIARDVPSIQITDLTLDSRNVQPGSAFIALQGARTHGLSFASQAIEKRATALLWESAQGVAVPVVPANVTCIEIGDLARQLGTIADRFFDQPSLAMDVTAVTGTNGKTTTAFMLAAAFERVGRDAAYAGTLGYGRVAAVHARPHTTPDCITVHRELAELRAAGVRCVGMEVTSHALDQHRVAGVRFDGAIFTNLTRDHLDYHGTFEAYGAAKARLFDWPALKYAVVNIEDAFGRQLAQRQQRVPLTVYGRASSTSEFVQSKHGARHVAARNVKLNPVGLDIELDTSWGEGSLHSRLIGAFNVDNVLAVLASVLNANVPFADALKVMASTVAPPGRMEMLTSPGKPLVVVDYAHTPDALEKALHAVRQHCSGKLWCVFGCGGERDAGKRPLMGAIAEANADGVIVTDDNPRGEDGDAIVAGILAGIRAPERALVQRDRARAIENAISQAQANDAVLVAGKGHEDYQIVGGTTRHFSDREVALAALRRRA
jgi:UDP-N-acetylmuramoyl-L-alanyl-D-glutamate--2,6-diaminopimelate ligase